MSTRIPPRLTPVTAEARLTLAPLVRRIVSLIYEALLLSAVLWLASLVYSLAEQQLALRHVRLWYQAYLIVIAGAYFVWQWLRGQTLPMKTWRMKLVTKDGNAIGLRQAVTRYVLGTLGAILMGVGLFWAVVDPERQFLHDRLAGTRLVSC